MLVYHLIVTALLAVVLGTVLGNLVYLWWVGRGARHMYQEGDERPLVSILIPARNEAGRVAECLESLERQTWEPMEVIVLDDCSEDGTFDVAAAFADRFAGLEVTAGAPLPVGWIGKPHACAQLARRARGDWLLFTDADVRFEPDGIARAMAIARATRADLLTAMPRQRTGSFAELLVIPLLYFLVVGLLPMFAMLVLRWWRLGAASGQFMLFRRDAYEAVGGHEAVRDRIVEDVALGHAIRRKGLRLVIANGTDLAWCRMYTSWKEVVEGFTKNTFAGLGESVGNLAIAIGLAVALFVVPPVGLVVGLMLGLPAASWGWFAGEFGLALAARTALAAAFRQSVWSIPLHPLAVGLAVGIALRSYWATRIGGGVEWRGRRYG